MVTTMGSSVDDPLSRWREGMPAGEGLLGHLPALERALGAAGYPAMSAWWLEALERFYGAPAIARSGER
jgi:hypothetical protein